MTVWLLGRPCSASAPFKPDPTSAERFVVVTYQDRRAPLVERVRWELWRALTEERDVATVAAESYRVNGRAFVYHDPLDPTRGPLEALADTWTMERERR